MTDLPVPDEPQINRGKELTKSLRGQDLLKFAPHPTNPQRVLLSIDLRKSTEAQRELVYTHLLSDEAGALKFDSRQANNNEVLYKDLADGDTFMGFMVRFIREYSEPGKRPAKPGGRGKKGQGEGGRGGGPN